MTPRNHHVSASATPAQHRRGRGSRGAVAVEFALILPILVLLIGGAVEFGRAYHTKMVMQGAVREGARVLALDSGDWDAATRNSAGGIGGDLTVTASGDPCERGEPASVTATYDFSYNIPFWGSDPSVELSATGVMRCERGGT